MGNPNPANITNEMWWLWEQLHALEPSDGALGGIYADKPGYHNTRAANDRKWPGNYSVTAAADRRGPSDKSAAIDWTFRSAQRGDYSRISKYFSRFLTAARADDPRLFGWREGYGQGDYDQAVEGYDTRHDCAVTSDSSHLWHIHLSETRQFVTSLDNKKALLSVLKGQSLAQYLAAGGKLVDGNTPVPKPSYIPEGDSGKIMTKLIVAKRGTNHYQVKRLQLVLRDIMGHKSVGKADGIWGSATDAAFREWQQKNRANIGRTPDGVCRAADWSLLLTGVKLCFSTLAGRSGHGPTRSLP